MLRLKNWFVNFNMNFELHNARGNFGTKFGILWLLNSMKISFVSTLDSKISIFQRRRFEQ